MYCVTASEVMLVCRVELTFCTLSDLDTSDLTNLTKIVLESIISWLLGWFGGSQKPE